MIIVNAPGTRVPKGALVVALCLACGGEISEEPDSGGIGGSMMSGQAGDGGRAGDGGASGAAGGGAGGAGGSMLPDAGGIAAGGSSMGGDPLGGGGQVAPELPADCPQINPIPAPGQTIVIQSINFRNSEIVLRNVSDTTQTIIGERTGWQWCNFPAYWAISEGTDVELSPGETFKFIAVYNTTGAREFDPEGGEMGIYTTTGSFTTASLMRAFVSWGDVIPQREATASAGGYWVYGDRVEIGPNDAGFVIVGAADRADGYQGVRAACLAAPPNEN